jgi:hypothetical protein
MPESHDIPNIAETSEALAGKLDALDDRDRAWLLLQMAHGCPAQQRELAHLLDALAAWKRASPAYRSHLPHGDTL